VRKSEKERTRVSGGQQRGGWGGRRGGGEGCRGVRERSLHACGAALVFLGWEGELESHGKLESYDD